ncbi:malto-oligosyltrehalose trehalohydrolase [Rhizobium sp. BK251]|uniref:malto-oligosyltrehalose trehalohydrolase n=1 Tax=Rhizobium sp. BK251 TaxID=2512125 RepID=UPI001051CF26|nr:malto-oligosyltrehalose trehalohydrolase [Rhizobium sp. BK251]TCL68311.1 maltooligosyl trehalose hydrolase [Rhizobium sp. BK251]
MATVLDIDRHRSIAGNWGATFTARDRVRFRLWAPAETDIKLRLGGEDRPMRQSGGGWFEIEVPGVASGDEYMFVLSDGLAVADPASRAQAADVHGPSRIVDPIYPWQNKNWLGRPWEEAVLYELHIGTFTPEGTFRAAMDRLPYLAEVGITALEVMPVAHFSGARGWGYDGVLHYAPHPAYGTPDDMKAFIDAAHGHGIMVLLDVVYNHFGPDGNYLHRYAPRFFRKGKATPWGAAIDFGREEVRAFFIENALYWTGEFNLDGLRLDAVEQIHDRSARHVLSDIAETVRSRLPDRHVHLVVEDQRNMTSLLQREADGETRRFTAEWNDDFHHVAHVIATGEKKGHYARFSADTWDKLALALRYGFIFPDIDASGNERQASEGEENLLPPTAFIDFLQNHDQVGNRAFGERLLSLAESEMVEALTAIQFLSPHIPFLFMGEEFGETQPFFFFTDYQGELGEAVRKGRIKEAQGFGGLANGRSESELPDPNDPATFENSKLRWDKLNSSHGRKWLGLVGDLAKLRQRYIVPLLSWRGEVETKTLEAADGILAISWTFGDWTLELRANLGTEPRRAPPFEGAVIFHRPDVTESEMRSGKLAGHSVLFAIDPGNAAGSG